LAFRIAETFLGVVDVAAAVVVAAVVVVAAAVRVFLHVLLPLSLGVCCHFLLREWLCNDVML
jgi:hypothetical protein